MGGRTAYYAYLYPWSWAKARPLSGKEYEKFDKLNATELVKFVTRLKVDVREDDSIIWRGVKHNIRHIPAKTRRDMYSEFYAERGVAI